MSIEEFLGRYEATTSPGELARLCVGDPSLVIFDGDGVNYRSREHWARRPSPLSARTATGEVTRDVHIDGRSAWVTYTSPDTNRTTLVLVDEDGAGWRIAHVHISPATPGRRPGGI